MLRIAYGVLAALIGIVFPIYVGRIVRGRASPSRNLFILSAGVQFFYSAAVILYFPAIETRIADWTGIAPLSLWLSNMGSLLSAFFCVRFFRQLSYAQDPTRRPFVWVLVAVMMAMTMALVLADGDVAPDGQPLTHLSIPLIVYRGLDIAFLGYCELRLILLWQQQVRIARDPALRMGLVMFTLGGYISFLWLALNVPFMLTLVASGASATLSLWYGIIFIAMGLNYLLGSVVPLIGMPSSALGSPVQAIVAYHQLEPLWADLTAAVPAVILPVTMTEREAIWRTADLNFLVYRRVLEMNDALHRLTVAALPDATTINVVRPLPPRSIWRRQAREDAQLTLNLLQHGPIGALAPALLEHLRLPYADQVRYLVVIAQSYRRLKRRTVALRRQKAVVQVPPAFEEMR
jgi:hypothetical protein